MNPHIAIVMGDAARARVAKSLTSFYPFIEYSEASKAAAGCRAKRPRLLVIGNVLTTGNGFDFIRALRLDPQLSLIPIVMLGSKNDRATRDAAIQCGADSFLVDPCPRSTLITVISDLLNRHIEREWKSLPPLQRQALNGTLQLFNQVSDVIASNEPIHYQKVAEACAPVVDAVESNDFKAMLANVKGHDNYTYVHSLRVATYLTLFGAHLKLPKNEQVLLASGGLLHDVGKMSIPHEVLNKPGKLTSDESVVMRSHVDATIRYLQACPDMPRGVLTIAAQHHEKLDGTGYPLGLKGDQLNRLARMASIIDVFSALTDQRVYRPAMEAEKALDIMVNDMATHLDMTLLRLFRQMLLNAANDIASPALAVP